jgi:hypothetical protein
MIGINKGFEAMIPKEPDPQPIYDYNVEFTLFKKVFSLSFKVKRSD